MPEVDACYRQAAATVLTQSLLSQANKAVWLQEKEIHGQRAATAWNGPAKLLLLLGETVPAGNETAYNADLRKVQFSITRY